ncbi:aspartyl aminopeptidase [Hanseniaspora vineae]
MSNSIASTYPAEFIDFLNATPTPYHAVENIKNKLKSKGFVEILERDVWHGKLEKLGKYYVTRNNSSIAAFAVGGKWSPGNPIAVTGAHTDSPVLRIKPISKKTNEGFLQVGVECYGGGIWHSWFDSDLSLAGRVMCANKETGAVESKLLNLKKPLLKIPTLAIHLDRSVNESFKFNKETHLLPIVSLQSKSEEAQNNTNNNTSESNGCCSSKENELNDQEFHCVETIIKRHHVDLLELIVKELNLESIDCIDDFELILYDNKPSTLGGLHDEFIFSGRLDNLTSCFTSTWAMAESCDTNLEKETGIRLMACFDHEEIGSVSAQGAESTFLPNLLERLNGLKFDDTDVSSPLPRSLVMESAAKSFFLSSDVSHGVHPNYASNHEKSHKPMLGGGTVIKINASQRYMTNAPGLTLVKKLANDAKVPIQLFVVANDSPCGSTIGPALAAHTGIRTLDLGNPILSMHSIRETGGADDLQHQIRLFKKFWEEYSTLEEKIIV